MKEQEYVIENKTFELKDIFDCGQCFRWNEEDDGSYIGVVAQNVIKVWKEKEKIHFKSVGKDELKDLV